MAEPHTGKSGDQVITDLPHESEVMQSINDDNAVNVIGNA